jgi:hypothetical protein
MTLVWVIVAIWIGSMAILIVESLDYKARKGGKIPGETLLRVALAGLTLLLIIDFGTEGVLSLLLLY